ncbi:MAG: hypothetical protein M3N48_06735 [Verrucomicrobiota bacterium]|nr:hypothetical protein [Verrucomicrobiota bacterium]
MQRKKTLVLTAAALVVAAVLFLYLVPLIVANGVRLWAERVARREGLQVRLDEIDAPLFRPVVVRNLRIESRPSAPFLIKCAASRLELDLSLSGIFTGARRPLHALKIEGLTLDIRRNPAAPSPSQRTAWAVFQNLLADDFIFSGAQVHIENGITTIDLRDGTVSGSVLESGVFSAREVTIASPWFHKTFSNLRGATSWQENRLAVGAISLIRGLDLDTITVDLARIGESRIGMEVSFDAFGGKIRARVSSEDRGDKRTWDIAGNGSGISLAQMSDTLEWTNRASGSLHASKFTFRGEMNDLRNATAALWAEVSGLTWSDRTADTVMIGASLYNREVQVEQLFIKQRNNQLTLSGEFAWPEQLSDWMQPAFRGDISASINDLGDFARLFGWSPSDFAGKLAANGNVSAREGKLGGQLSVSGKELVVFRSAIESLEVKLALEESRLGITKLELRQQNDFFRAEGSFALTGDRSYTATAQTSVADLANYRGFIPSQTRPVGGSLAAEWNGRGARGEDSGTWHARGHNLRVAGEALVPFEAELAADYSPESIFFREFHLWNQRADFGAFVTVAKTYLHAQDVWLTLNGRPRLEGNIYLPLSVVKLRGGARWLAALGPDPFFDVDLTVEATDLAEFAAAVRTKPDMSGQVSAKIQLSGTPASLQANNEIHLRDFVLDGASGLTADVETRLALGMANFKVNALARGSDPVKIDGTLPLRLEKRDAEYALSSDGPLSARLTFPAIILAKLPRYLSPAVFTRGILSGNIAIADSVQHPLITGAANLVDGQFLRGSTLSVGVNFKGRDAMIDFVQLKEAPALDVSAKGELDFSDLDNATLRLFPTATIFATALADDDCVSSIEFFAGTSGILPARQVQELAFNGSVFTRSFTISFPSSNDADPPQEFPFCHDSPPGRKTLTFQISPAFNP